MKVSAVTALQTLRESECGLYVRGTYMGGAVHADDLRTTAESSESVSRQDGVINSFCSDSCLKLNTDIYIYIYTHRESLVHNHEPCAKALGNNIYIYVCHASAHALRMRKIIIIITCTCNGSPWFSWYTAKVWHAAAFSCNLREASALMRISSYIYNNYIYICIIINIILYMSIMLLVPRRTPLNAQRANFGPASDA